MEFVLLPSVCVFGDVATRRTKRLAVRSLRRKGSFGARRINRRSHTMSSWTICKAGDLLVHRPNADPMSVLWRSWLRAADVQNNAIRCKVFSLKQWHWIKLVARTTSDAWTHGGEARADSPRKAQSNLLQLVGERATGISRWRFFVTVKAPLFSVHTKGSSRKERKIHQDTTFWALQTIYGAELIFSM